jgi:hypothetical protein
LFISSILSHHCFDTLRNFLLIRLNKRKLLSSRDSLAAFFAKLGYDTNDLLVQDVAAMGFSSDNLPFQDVSLPFGELSRDAGAVSAGSCATSLVL